MLKIKLLLSFIFFTSSLFAQPLLNNFKINWGTVSIITAADEEQYPMLNFDGAVYNGTSGLLPSFRFDFAVPDSIKNVKVEILNQQFEMGLSLDSLELPADFQELGSEIQMQTILKNGPEGKFVRIELIPIIKNEILQAYFLLNSFSLKIELIKNPKEKKIAENTFMSESVMADGNWYKFKVDKSGVYKISGADLENAGLTINSIIPSQIAVYGFGGMLNERNSDFRYSDIPELSIIVEDGNDSKFDAVDYLMFYAAGPDTWEYSATSNVFEHNTNVYDRNAYYYVHLKNEAGKRIKSLPLSEKEKTTEITSFDDYAIVEDENYNLIGSGRRWLGDKYDFTTSYTYNFDFENLVLGSQAFLRAKVVARSNSNSSFDFMYSEQDLGNISIRKIPTGSYPAYAYDNTFEKYFELSKDNLLDIQLKYNRPTANAIAWLDFIEINVKRELIFNDEQLKFRALESVGIGNISDFTIRETSSDTRLWDISDFPEVGSLTTQFIENRSQFKVETSTLREFMAFTPEMAYSPTFVELASNQNLHAIENTELLIVSPESFLDQANELANFHREEGLTVEVVTLKQIYNEYSSGSQDVSAIRDFVRSVYIKENSSKPLKYLLLFGDASYDYLDRETGNSNLVPTFESVESFDPITSIAVDDYFGFLEESEGDLYSDDVDIGIGRMPISTIEEAQTAVDKIKHYASSQEVVLGDWRNVICLVADDEDNNLHIRQANDLANLLDTIFPGGNLDKIYVDAFAQISTPAGQRYPKVNEAINERIHQGALILSYTGHGGETGWGQERYLDMPDIESWTNKNKLAVFLTATCEFARFDDPKRVSAGEHIFLNENGGGIALFTTTRATYAGSNFVMSKNFYKHALDHPDSEYLRMGDILRLTKRASGSGFNILKFVLLGDPALKISIPQKEVHVNSINGLDLSQNNDTLKALSYVQIQGQINNRQGIKSEDFNGEIISLVYDKSTEIKTNANDPGSNPFSFYVQNNIIYKGKAEVKNGDFEFSFVVPKDISYNIGKGKLSLYATALESDASGYNRNVLIGGYNENSQLDNEGPEIELYLNDENFRSGGLTNENPVLIAKVADENGINTIGNGIGHDITVVLNEVQSELRVLNSFYESDFNTFKRGSIRFPFYNLENGEHELKFKVWDVYNNSSTAKLKFHVSNSPIMALEALMNYPNPFNETTRFSFEQNSYNQQLKMSIDIYSMDGKLIKHLEDQFLPYSSRVNHIVWNGTDSNGNKIKKGIYIYRLQIEDESGMKEQKTSKLVFIK